MYYGKELSEVTPSEKFDAWMDFSNDFPSFSESYLVSVAITLSVIDTDDGVTADATPNDHVVGLPSIEQSEISNRNTRAVQRIETPTAGNRYLIKFLGTTETGQILEATSHFWCRVAT